jgi:pimeloyl-ACP methyl ester carboxylesterase
VPTSGRYARLKEIKQPVLVVQGKTDVMVPTINSFTLQQELPDAELIIYPDSGHGSIFQFPERFVRDATKFLDS